MAETKRHRFRRRRRIYRKRRTNLSLRIFLRAKAAFGRWDKRYCAYYGVSTDVNDACKKAITRAYARGLVPTSTTGGSHAPGSLHYQHRAADLGVRSDIVGTAKQTKKLSAFQSREWNRGGHTELIGPINNKIILRGSRTSLGEGTALEQAHDNHVHVGY